jgi:F0F1-type ATP synthase delta subunit
MSAVVSRRRLAKFIVDRIEAGQRTRVIRELAAYIVEEGLVRETDLITSDIEAEFAARGHVVADVTSARALDDASRSQLTEFIAQEVGAERVELREEVDADLIGGVVIEAPGKYLDSSLASQLQQLKVNSRR